MFQISSRTMTDWWRMARAGLVAAVAVPLALAAMAGCTAAPDAQPVAFNADLAFLEAINDAGPKVDPAVIFLLMAQYGDSGREQAGIDKLQGLLNRYRAELSAPQQSIYLAAIGILRARRAGEIPLFSRIGWVNDTIATLEDAKRLAADTVFPVRWATGLVYSQLPGFFDMEQIALQDLQWCLEHATMAPHPGWLREVHHGLARVYLALGDEARSAEHLKISGLGRLDYPVTFTTSASVHPETGGAFFPRRLREALPGRIYVLSGFEFTEYYFVVSKNGHELIAIDAGTRPDSAASAYEYLGAQVPGLPPLTTVLITHAHWDHIGGHRYFRLAAPGARFYARANYAEEMERESRLRIPFAYFFGRRYDPAAVADFRPDRLVSGRERITVDGTEIEFIPIEGGETHDALLIHLPEERVLFAGDFTMPFLGAPFVEEGNLDGLLDALGIVETLRPSLILHGHEPLTRFFGSPAMLADLREALSWLGAETRRKLASGATRDDLHRLNLIPPIVLQNPPVQVPYLVMRAHVIDRLYDQAAGYWHPDLGGMDYISPAERGAMLHRYFGVSEAVLEDAVNDMMANGDSVAAARLVYDYSAYAPASERVRALKTRLFLRLAGSFQEHNVFKFLIYSEQAGAPLPQLELAPDSAIK
jgi:glyoxylase-like metal-dependent hydrolase (beta-lactamase superfamily II)